MFLLIVLGIPGFADACKPSSLAAIGGTTCDIGNLRFTFGNPGANESLFDLATGKYLSYQSISSMTFTPFVEGSKAGFTFGGLPSIELSGRDTHLAAEASVYYQVVPLQGKIVQVGAVAGSAAATAWGYGLNGSSVLSRSYAELAYSVSPTNSWLATDLVGVLTSADGPAQGTPWTAVQPMPFCSYCGYTSWASIVGRCTPLITSWVLLRAGLAVGPRRSLPPRLCSKQIRRRCRSLPGSRCSAQEDR